MKTFLVWNHKAYSLDIWYVATHQNDLARGCVGVCVLDMLIEVKLKFLPENNGPRSLIDHKLNHLVHRHLLRVCSKYTPEAKGGHMFYKGLYRENIHNIFLSETTMPRALIFGM